MIPDAAYVYEGLLRHNYFPMVRQRRDEIPPFFSTRRFTPDIANGLIDHLGNGDGGRKESDGFDQIEYRATRFNNALRCMHIPHPLPYARLCRCLRDNWDSLNYICTNKRSQIKPDRHDDGRILSMPEYEDLASGRVVVMEKECFPDDVEQHLKLSLGAAFLVEADVSGCFPSLYTHAIPWALIGRSEAKRNRSKREWYNQLDERQRKLKRGETHGVPIGPATSNIVNEIILARVDEALAGYHFVRYIDDYKCYCPTREDADKFLRDLEAQLGRYLLSLNARKVSVTSLPVPSKHHWVIELKDRLQRQIESRAAVDFLDAAVHLQSCHREGSVIKYAARAVSSKLTEEAAPLYCRYLLQLAFHYPAVLPILCEVVKEHWVTLSPSDVEVILMQHSTYRRSDMVCWSLYLMSLIGGQVSDKAANQIIEARDCMAMTSLLAMEQHVDLLADHAKTFVDEHYYELDANWLLIHELELRNDLPDVVPKSYLENTGLSFLVEQNITFLGEEEKDEGSAVEAMDYEAALSEIIDEF